MGSIEMIVGCMFSGKTTALIEQLNRAKKFGRKIQVFKPELDTRYDQFEITSHDQVSVPALPVKDGIELLTSLEDDTEIVFIDEVQFFDLRLPEALNVLASQGIRVVACGLDTDWRGRPFGPVPQLLAMADKIEKKMAKCTSCGAPANRSQRIVDNSKDILIGSTEYEPRCRKHFSVPMEVEKPIMPTAFWPTQKLDIRPGESDRHK